MADETISRIRVRERRRQRSSDFPPASCMRAREGLMRRRTDFNN